MNMLTLLLAVTLSSGNAEFDQVARDGAAEIAVGRIVTELKAKGAPAGTLEKAMLAASNRFVTRDEAKAACKLIYAVAVEEEFERQVKAVQERLGIPLDANGRESDESSRGSGKLFAAIRSIREDSRSEALFEAAFEAERKSACEKQAKTIAGAVKPAEIEVETKDEAVLRAEMTDKVAAQQKGGVFEENLKYISETIVDPVIESAKKEMKRQREYLTRTKCEAYAPSVLETEITENLRRNVAERKAKEADPAQAWDVFPKTLENGLGPAVERRTVDRVTKNVDDVAVAVDAETVLRTMAADPLAHRKADESEKVFRGIYAAQVMDGARTRAAQEAPAKERAEFEEYVRAHATAPELVKAVEARIRREVLPKWKAVRAEVAKSEAERIWPTLADRTWYPDAELADAVAARSDYAAAVKGWRKVPELESLAKADHGDLLMEETSADADQSVAAAFDLARSAIAAQNAIVGEVEPSVLGEAKARKSSFWRKTPDFKAIVGLLTEAVEAKWTERRAETLWGDGERPSNADAQHAVLFPSVRKRIELVARQILEDMEKPEPEPEQKPQPQEPPEDPTESDQQSEEEPQLLKYSIVVERDGDEVTVRLEQGKSTVAERSAKAKMSDYQGAMKFVSDKLGTDILKLK